MQKRIDRDAIRRRIRHRIRKKVSGTAARPRLAVFRSDKHIYAQAIDDGSGRTIAHASSLDAELKGTVKQGGNVIAGTPKIYEAMVECLGPLVPEGLREP